MCGLCLVPELSLPRDLYWGRGCSLWPVLCCNEAQQRRLGSAARGGAWPAHGPRQVAGLVATPPHWLQTLERGDMPYSPRRYTPDPDKGPQDGCAGVCEPTSAPGASRPGPPARQDVNEHTCSGEHHFCSPTSSTYPGAPWETSPCSCPWAAGSSWLAVQQPHGPPWTCPEAGSASPVLIVPSFPSPQRTFPVTSALASPACVRAQVPIEVSEQRPGPWVGSL